MNVRARSERWEADRPPTDDNAIGSEGVDDGLHIIAPASAGAKLVLCLHQNDLEQVSAAVVYRSDIGAH